MTIHPVVFYRVDKIDMRRHIWSAVGDRVELLIDGRMAAEVLRVLTVGDAAGRDAYPQTLFAADEAYRDGCTARSTVYCANIAAGVMVHGFTRWLRGLPLDFGFVLNLLAGELAVR